MSSDDQRQQRERYLNEQIARQQRGEPIDVDWVREELDRVRKEQQETLASSKRRLWLLMAVLAILFVAMVVARMR